MEAMNVNEQAADTLFETVSKALEGKSVRVYIPM